MHNLSSNFRHCLVCIHILSKFIFNSSFELFSQVLVHISNLTCSIGLFYHNCINNFQDVDVISNLQSMNSSPFMDWQRWHFTWPRLFETFLFHHLDKFNLHLGCHIICCEGDLCNLSFMVNIILVLKKTPFTPSSKSSYCI